MTEIGITLHPRRYGESKYSGRGRIVVGFLDLLTVAFFLFFARKPMLLFGVTGLSLAADGLLVGLVTIVLRILELMPTFGYRPLLYLIFFFESVGFLLFCFAFLSQLFSHQKP